MKNGCARAPGSHPKASVLRTGNVMIAMQIRMDDREVAPLKTKKRARVAIVLAFEAKNET
jgi:hypothetical protein